MKYENTLVLRLGERLRLGDEEKIDKSKKIKAEKL